MGRPALDIPEKILAAAITDHRAGVLSKAEISRRYGIPIETLRRRLKGIAQDGTSTMRALVAASVAGMPNPEMDAAVASTVAKGAALASQAMITADEIFRGILKRVQSTVADEGAMYSPKDLKDLGSAAKEAMEGVRRVRELDAPTGADLPKIEVEFIRKTE